MNCLKLAGKRSVGVFRWPNLLPSVFILLLSSDPLILVDFVEPSLIRAPFSAQIDDYLYC